MIKIGVSACFMHPDPQRAFFGPKVLAYLEQDMARYLSRPGIMPILIPDLPEPEWSAFLGEMDGFVFQGGADLAPETYGETPIENGRWPGDRVRDLYELRIMKYAFDRKKADLRHLPRVSTHECLFWRHFVPRSQNPKRNSAHPSGCCAL
jgi:putative glutamine amidotransferase